MWWGVGALIWLWDNSPGEGGREGEEDSGGL